MITSDETPDHKDCCHVTIGNKIDSEESRHNQEEICKSDEEKRPQFGTRFLTEGENVYSYNAWDNVKWDDCMEKAALEIISNQTIHKMTEAEFEKIEENANQYWNEFYNIHRDKFYKDRQWIFTEFPELLFNNCKTQNDEQKVIFEVGCGVGNTIFPILQRNEDLNLHVFCCDFSETAVSILKENETYGSRCTAFVCDITKEDWNLPFPVGSVDIVIMVYVLSSILPDKMKIVLKKTFNCLKPGGFVLFRDYGRYDMSQLRFKQGRCISDNLYARGEGTFVYFFDKEEVSNMFSDCGYKPMQIICDKRLQVNRRKLLKMYRVWIQGKFLRPLNEDE